MKKMKLYSILENLSWFTMISVHTRLTERHFAEYTSETAYIKKKPRCSVCYKISLNGNKSIKRQDYSVKIQTEFMHIISLILECSRLLGIKEAGFCYQNTLFCITKNILYFTKLSSHGHLWEATVTTATHFPLIQHRVPLHSTHGQSCSLQNEGLAYKTLKAHHLLLKCIILRDISKHNIFKNFDYANIYMRYFKKKLLI